MNEDMPQMVRVIGPGEIYAILFRRRWWLVLPALAGVALASALGWLMTPTYRSSATLLIQSSQVLTSFAPPRSTNDATERVARIRQQIVSRANLTKLIVDADLYENQRRKLPFDDVLALMRKAVVVDLVSASGPQRQSGVNDTIAFELSYTYSNAATAHDITEKLVAMFMAEDKRLSTEQAIGAAGFLARRVDELRSQMVDLEGKRRMIESRYAGALPNQVALSTQAGSALRAEVSRLDAETQGLMQQNSLLAARSVEIASAPRPEYDGLRRAEERLAQLGATYSDTHPDVIAARAAVVRQRQAAKAAMPLMPGGGAVAAEIAAGRSRIATLGARRGELVGSIAQMERMTALAPQASYELNNLERDYDNLKRQYQDVRDKQMEAQIAANLQAEDKGERFSVVNAASLPNAPIRPRRVQMAMWGLFGGLTLGLIGVMLWEFTVGPIHGENAVSRLMGAAPLAVIPMLKSGPNAALPARAGRWPARLALWRLRAATTFNKARAN
ncbi:uncharacterized protein involved in exopolysaccharide biosynthesis [Novosphingobium sp. SG751A]|uniref:GumC family protein n=1 Tax=Novosphingobium sp. SG751A TaxID=2587000 RepID=UPI0015530010|nr:Wzz/FepE/Etk N-terminal domain-containing protein [Novosphingobium sp. SG751A]NOW46461.1 uncharacterized protein involved in exopolysaccharide biosynthesis [Novosphingobium sp. SG751A]